MAEEKNDHQTENSDDVHVLRELLHSIRGLSPVSSVSCIAVQAEADES